MAMSTECFRDPSETLYEHEHNADGAVNPEAAEALSVEEALEVPGWRKQFDEIMKADPIEDAYFELAEAMDRLYAKVKLIGREKRDMSREAEHVRLAAVRFQWKLTTAGRRTRRKDRLDGRELYGE